MRRSDSRLAVLVEKILKGLSKLRPHHHGDIPQHIGINIPIVMHDPISRADNAANIRNPLVKLRVYIFSFGQSFAYSD
jgi:hypothetical protein